MNHKDYMRKIYKNFYDFITECSSKELEYFILDSKFTTFFNTKISEVIKEIENEGKSNIEATIIFSTKGEIALIDSYIVGRYLANSYKIYMERHYKQDSLNKIVKYIVNGNKKSKKDFLILSFSELNNTLKSMYSDIKCKKEIVDKYKQLYNLEKCEDSLCLILVAVILILEDICKFTRIEEEILIEAINCYLNKM
ncbi:hypothetical protein [Clostridium scatologenes]|uniref:Uncharacterized protein n=1 Tax=Clostridium scatologenes TaxID=1548 RepID=A0A0E3K3C8_CLOSL|nr:hypothetical protein [Clostridium scatologenes]AKA71514.1 hypothetical protein CSCA_4389 [Clostridium scatologenes]